MTSLALRLAAPLQSWGDSSRFLTRGTSGGPTKSGVLGLIGAALGLRRTDPLESLLGLTFGVRLDQPGRVIRDFQTAITLDGKKSMPLTERYYLADAAFLAVVEGEEQLIRSIDAALRSPTFPLYLGRRSCPPTSPLTLEVTESSAFEVLSSHPWVASKWVQDKASMPTVRCQVLIDKGALPAEIRVSASTCTARDVPLSFDPEYRNYGWREVSRTWIDVDTPVRVSTGLPHDPHSILEVGTHVLD